jgi:hypothetical protein
MPPGGRRPRSGRHPRDTVRVGCAIPRLVYEELIRRETESGIYRSRIIAELVCEAALRRGRGPRAKGRKPAGAASRAYRITAGSFRAQVRRFSLVTFAAGDPRHVPPGS